VCILPILSVSLLSESKFKSISTLIKSVYASTYVYFSVCACAYECYCRRTGYVFQYYEAIEQELEGSLEIVTKQEDGQEVLNGSCVDFFEFQMVNHRSCVVV